MTTITNPWNFNALTGTGTGSNGNHNVAPTQETQEQMTRLAEVFDNTPKGVAAAVRRALESTPGEAWNYKKLQTETGFSATQIQTAVLHLRRSGLPIRGSKGVYRLDKKFEPTKNELQRMVVLFESMKAHAEQEDDGTWVFKGGFVRSLTQRGKRWFKVNKKFSRNAANTTFRHLTSSGCVEARSSFEKVLKQHPLDVFENPGGIRRVERRRNVPSEGQDTPSETPSEDLSEWARAELERRRAAEVKAEGSNAPWFPKVMSLPKVMTPNDTFTAVGYTNNGSTIVRDAQGKLYELHEI